MIKKYLPVIFLGFLVAILFVVNYVPNTFLVGWDNLQTELAPTLAIKRAFFSAWQEYQSFGLLAGMAHASDLVRSILIWIMSFILPAYIIRYTFHISMILVGALGMFELLKQAGFKQKKPFAFFGAVFYIVNFATIQIMFLPFEPFSVFLASLPWAILIFLKIIGNTQHIPKKDWILFLIINVLATPAFYVQQIFVVYLLVLGLFCLGLFRKNPIQIVTNTAFAFLLIFMINSFWLLPQVYFLTTSSSVVANAKINQLSTEDTFYSNKDKGNIKDFITLRGFLYDSKDSRDQPLFNAWKQNRETLFGKILLYALSAVCAAGLIAKKKFHLCFISVSVLIALVLLSNTFPFDFINQLIRNNSLINQIFRSPFTKFAIPYALVVSYFFVCGLDILYRNVKKTSKNHEEKTYVLFCAVVLISIFLYALPAFKGNYFSKTMQITIPNDYFKATYYFNQIDKNKRIALLPEYTFWGWFNTKWGYNGSGFLWYGIQQPIVSRAFDVWSTQSESYFWETKTALEAENISAFENVLEKYNVDYLILDRSLLPIVSNSRSLRYDQITSMISKSSRIKLVKKWNFISIYKVSHTKKITNFISVANSLPSIGPKVRLTNNDTPYQTYHDYSTTERKETAYYPFLDLTSQTQIPNKTWSIGESASSWYFLGSLPQNLNGFDVSSSSGALNVNLYKNNVTIGFIMPYTITIDKKNIIAQFPKMKIDAFDLSKTTPQNCADKKGAIYSNYQNNQLHITTINGATGCFSFVDSHLDQNYGYLIKVADKNNSGPRLFLYLFDLTKQQTPIEDTLSTDTRYYVLGPKFDQGTGYSFDFQNKSYNTIPSSNTLNELSIYLLPYNELKQLHFQSKSTAISTAKFATDFSAKKISYYLYSVSLPSKNKNSTIILHQAYHPGWKAYVVRSEKSEVRSWITMNLPFIFGKELKNHILVNNWENGWNLEDQDVKVNRLELVIIYWPQYLEYIGLTIIVITFLYLILCHSRKNGNLN